MKSGAAESRSGCKCCLQQGSCFEELIQREPHNAMYYEEVQRVQENQHIHVTIKLQHILETDDKFWRAAGLPRLDIPEHLWGV